MSNTKQMVTQGDRTVTEQLIAERNRLWEWYKETEKNLNAEYERRVRELTEKAKAIKNKELREVATFAIEDESMVEQAKEMLEA